MKERVPVIIAVTDAAFIGELTKELALSKTFRLGGFTVLKPDDVQGLLRRLHIAAELEEPAAQPDKQPPSLEEMATTVLRKLAVPCNLKGFRCLRDAIVLAAEDVGYLQQIVQKLYPEVAQRNNTTPSRAERAMPSAPRKNGLARRLWRGSFIRQRPPIRNLSQPLRMPLHGNGKKIRLQKNKKILAFSIQL